MAAPRDSSELVSTVSAARMPVEPPFTVLSCLLGADEKIVWAGQPRPHAFLQRGAVALMYGITWVSLGLFWYLGLGGNGEHSTTEDWWRLYSFFGLAFVLAGLSFFIEPIRLLRRAFCTWYVITNRRVFIATRRTADVPELREFTPEELAPPLLQPRLDRLHDLILTRRAQETPHLPPRLDSGFFGLQDGAGALAALKLRQS